MAQRRTAVRQVASKRVTNTPKSVAGKEYTPRTELGRELMAARRRIVASGERLLSCAEVEREVKERRGGSLDK